MNDVSIAYLEYEDLIETVEECDTYFVGRGNWWVSLKEVFELLWYI